MPRKKQIPQPEEFQQIWNEFSEQYDLDGIETINDKQNLESLINNVLRIRKLDRQLTELIDSDRVSELTKEISDLSRIITGLQTANMNIEKQLGIDRKSRKKDNESSVGDYLLTIKSAARDFLETRFVKVYCPNCKIMVGRIAPVHEHTEYYASFQCSQCDQKVLVKRLERDVFFDLAKDDREWRRKFPLQIIQPRTKKADKTYDLVIGGETETVTDVENGD